MKTTDEIMALADQWMFMRLHPSQTWSDVEIARNRLKAAIEELAKPMETPLTDQRIIEIAKATDTAEPGRDGYILPVSFARAIESEIKGLNRVKQGVSGTVRIVTDWSAA